MDLGVEKLLYITHLSQISNKREFYSAFPEILRKIAELSVKYSILQVSPSLLVLNNKIEYFR